MFWEPPCFLVEWVILAHHLHSLPCSKISHFFVLSAWLLLGDSGIQNANFAYYLRCHRAKYICCINTYTNTHVWRRQWQPNPVLLPGKSHGWRKLVGCSPWGHEESDMTEWLHCHFSPSCTGEGNGNPLQCPCLENPRAGRAWWAAVYGVTQSQTWLKRLSSSSSTHMYTHMYILIYISN